MAGVALLTLLGACEAPFGLGSPTTPTLERGVADGLNGARSVEIAGSYLDAGNRWTIDLQFQRPDVEHLVASDGKVSLEAVMIGGLAYFRGRDFLAAHLGDDPASKRLLGAGGNAWWKGSAVTAPRLTAFIDGTRLRATFLGSAVTARADHVKVDGVGAVDLSGPRAHVLVAEAEPHRLLGLQLTPQASIEGIAAADFRFSNYDHDFGIATPPDVLDFADLSTLPPIYTVESVDTSGCGSPCIVSAGLRNLGGRTGARAPSTVTFRVSDPATQRLLGSCQTTVRPDVGYNSTTSVSCTIFLAVGQTYSAMNVTATPDNPGRG